MLPSFFNNSLKLKQKDNLHIVVRVGEVIQKKLLPFGHCPKVAVTPPPVLDTCGVTLKKIGKIYN